MSSPTSVSREPATAEPRTPPSGVASIVTGILGLTALPVIGPILALVFGYQSRREAAERPDRYSDDLGRVGRILGWVGIGLAALGVVFVLILFLLFL